MCLMLHCVSERSLAGRQREPYFQSLILYNPNIHVDQPDRNGTKYLVNISPLKNTVKMDALISNPWAIFCEHTLNTFINAYSVNEYMCFMAIKCCWEVVNKGGYSTPVFTASELNFDLAFPSVTPPTWIRTGFHLRPASKLLEKCVRC